MTAAAFYERFWALTLCIFKTLANSEDTDEMQQYAAFHQDLHCLLRLNQPSRTETHANLEKFTRDS